ncbi:HEPN domain-containing protein [Flagellimonas iocasae]|uniref:HEPN domain-containing protein n=1 Tax=Flagellimonas iocasae TaxID=2055905 RepID=A0ABW4XXI1_9FLAO
MKYHTNIPENFERAEELYNLIDSMLNVITIDAIFLSRKQIEGDTTYHMLTLFTDVDNDPIPNEILALVSKLGKEHPDFRIRIYTEEQSEIGLSRGSLYFLEHCCLGDTVYARMEGANLLDYPEMTLTNIIKRTSRYYDSEMKKVTTFANTADILIKEGDYAIATFNMHQAFELGFRFIEQMCIGKCKVTHSIISHINYCRHYFPTIVPFSKTSELDNNELLLLLEHAYSVARYGNEFEIDKTQAQTIQSELGGFIEAIWAVYRRHYDHCMNRIEGEDLGSTNETQNEARNVGDKLEESLWGKLKDWEEEHFITLMSLNGHKTIDITTEGYLDSSFMISNLIKVCITAMESDMLSNRVVPEPEHNIREVLGYVLDMMPHDEMRFLDKISKLLSEPKYNHESKMAYYEEE